MSYQFFYLKQNNHKLILKVFFPYITPLIDCKLYHKIAFLSTIIVDAEKNHITGIDLLLINIVITHHVSINNFLFYSYLLNKFLIDKKRTFIKFF